MMRKILVAIFCCASVAAYAQVKSYYQFVDSRPITEAPLVFNCITSTPNLLCPGFVQTDPQGNATTAYNVLPVIAGQWALGATGAAVPTTAMYIAVTSAGNLTGWDRSVRPEPTVPWNVFILGGVNPGTAGQWGLGATTAAPPTTAMNNGLLARSIEPAATSGGNLTTILGDLIGRIVNVPYAARELAVQGTASTNGSLALTIIPAQGANVKIYTTSLECGRDDAGTTAIFLTIGDLKGTQLVLPNSGGGGGNNMTFPVPLVTTANTALQVTPSAAVSFLRCSAQGYTGY